MKDKQEWREMAREYNSLPQKDKKEIAEVLIEEGMNPALDMDKKPSECDMSGYDLTKASERFRWKCAERQRIVRTLFKELKESSRCVVFRVDGKRLFDEDLISLSDVASASVKLFSIYVED